MNENKVTVAGRESRLAIIQSNLFVDHLKMHFPEKEIRLLTMKTTGDRILDRRLDQIGGKGLFVKELEAALRSGEADFAVHSLKDMPMELPEDLPLLCVSKREDPRDVLVLPAGAEAPDPEKPIGTSSLRRILQLRALFPEYRFESVRGNLQTRLRKLDEGQYSGLILAAAGLKRLGLESRISRYFEVDEVIPAAGQGILAVQGRRDGIGSPLLRGFADPEAYACAAAERAYVRALGGGCSSPVAAYASLCEDGMLQLTGLFVPPGTEETVIQTERGSLQQAELLGTGLAAKMLDSGNKCGKVWLVGAGPGDPGLMTRKGADCLAKADVVIFDSLISESILAGIPHHAELIDAGKRAGDHKMRQEETNRLLLQKAREGKCVVRLKGGDPFLFGRGGEELELLEQNGIPYEVVPGVSSAIAVPAYHGIPVTHREFSSSVHIITGHRKQGGSLQIDFEALVRTKGTLVFLMGVSALRGICTGLIRAGMDPETPAAILQEGTGAAQRSVKAAIGTLPDLAEQAAIGAPAIIVVGTVCRLKDSYNWYERLPLFGMKVLLTRPRELSSGMAEKLRTLGAEVIELPAIRTVPIADNAALRCAFSKLSDYSWIAFTSPSGVRIFFDEMESARVDIRSLAGIRTAVLGEGTKRELEKHGIYADLMPESYDGASLGKLLAESAGPGDRILLPRASAGNREILEELQEFSVDDIPAYDTVPCDPGAVDAGALVRSGTLSCAVFTSSSSVRAFSECCGGVDLSGLTAICIGRQTMAAAEACGMKCRVAKKATMDSLAEAVITYKKEK